MASSRAGFIGMGLVLILVGFFLSNLICGIGIIFLIVGLVMWQQDEDDL